MDEARNQAAVDPHVAARGTDAGPRADLHLPSSAFISRSGDEIRAWLMRLAANARAVTLNGVPWGNEELAQRADEAVATLAALQESYDRLKADLADVMREVQRQQPNGSPPPGGPVILTRWILTQLREEHERVKAELDNSIAALVEHGGTQVKQGLAASIRITLVSMQATRVALIERARAAEQSPALLRSQLQGVIVDGFMQHKAACAKSAPWPTEQDRDRLQHTAMKHRRAVKAEIDVKPKPECTCGLDQRITALLEGSRDQKDKTE